MDNQAQKTEAQGVKVEKLESDVGVMMKQYKMLEVHLGQLASSSNSHQKGKLPSTTEVNPRGQVNVIHLRSGTTYDGPSMPQDDVKMVSDDKAPSLVENKAELHVETSEKIKKK